MQPSAIIYKAKLDDRGRVYIPTELRKKLKLKAGSTLYIILSKEGIRIFSVEAFEKEISKVISE